jgi:methionyl-tRNA formyltransferase
MARVRERELKIWKTRPGSETMPEPCPILRPAEIQIARKNRLMVGCGDGFPLELIEVSLPSRGRITGVELANGLKLKSGEFFESPASVS